MSQFRLLTARLRSFDRFGLSPLPRVSAGIFTFGLLASVSAPVGFAQTANGSDFKDDATALDRYVVTGTRVAGRTIESSAAPIDLFSGSDVTAANQSNLLDTLNTLVPSFNLPTVSTPDIGSMIRAGTLRGLGPDKTLVLINGKRRHSTGFLGAGGYSGQAPADLSLIPTGSIDRIEVLRDGASAIYGSDAIAGVINIITKSGDRGGEYSFRYGQYFGGDGLTRVGKASSGFKLGSDGFLNVAVQVDDKKATITNSPVPSTYLFYFPIGANGQLVAPTGLGSTNGLPAGATPNPKEATRDNNAWKNTGSAAYNLKTIALNFDKPLFPNVEGYGFGSYGFRTSSAGQNFRPPARNEVIRAIYPDGFTPYEALRENDFELTAGLKGKEALGWNWDLSATYGQDSVGVYTLNSDNPTYGLLTPVNFYDGTDYFAATTVNLDLRRTFNFGTLPLDTAFGGEFRHENFQIRPGEVASYADGHVPVLDGPNAGLVLVGVNGAQALPGFRPADATDATRNAKAAYGSASTRLTSAWLVDLAGRYENFSDFGDTYTGRVSTRYDFGKLLGVRGTISNGFHAPALAAENYRNTANINTYISHTIAVTSPEAKALGAQPLKPEKSRNYTLGLVSEPVKGLYLAVDAYEIDLKNLITQSTSIRDAIYPGTATLITAAGFAPSDAVSFFINGVNVRTRGVEFTAETTTRLKEFGNFRWSLAASRSYTGIVSVVPTPAILAQYGVPLFAASNATNITYQGPRNKVVFGVNWTKSRFGVNLRETYYGPIFRLGTPSVVATSGPYAGLKAIPNGNPAELVTDLDLSYRISKSLTFSLSANNLFNVKPGKQPTPLLSANQTFAYNNYGPVGAAGGFWSTALRYAF